MEPAIEALVEQVRGAAADRRPLRIRGGGTKDFYGNASPGEVLDPRGCQGIVAYDPAELFVTARAGTSLALLEAELHRNGQMLAFEPPHFGAGATVGGCIAAGLAGPRRCAAGPTHGSLRDFVLGATLLDGRGSVLRFGGTVIKNVAGFDVSRSLAGSLGILGVILEVTLKVLPRPQAEATLRFDMTEMDAIGNLNRWAGRPLPLSASLWRDGELWLRLAGASAAVDQAQKLLGGERLEDAQATAFWIRQREQSDAWFAGDTPLWRLGLPSTAPPLPSGEPKMMEWGGAQRWLRSTQPAARIRALAAEHGGHATLFRRGALQSTEESAGAFMPLSAPLLAIHQRLKAQFDPQRIFNPGRMVPGL